MPYRRNRERGSGLPRVGHLSDGPPLSARLHGLARELGRAGSVTGMTPSAHPAPDMGSPPDTPGAAARPTRLRWQRGWYVYDWASSAYATAVIAVFLGPFLTDLAKAGAGPDQTVSVLGLGLRPGAVFPFAVALAVVCTAVVLPGLGAWVDITGRAVVALWVIASLGGLATISLALVTAHLWMVAVVLLVASSVALTTSYAVYNAFLPRIATFEESDRVSSRGWALGYVGGGIVLAVGLAVEAGRDTLGISESAAVRFAFVFAGLWWAGFTLVTVRALRSVPWPAVPHTGNLFSAGHQQLRASLRQARHDSRMLRFLLAYLFYNQGVQTVFAVIALYAIEELGFDRTRMLPAITALMVLAFVGSLAMVRVAARFGPLRTIAGMLVAWTAVVLAAAVTPAGSIPAFFSAAAVGGFIVGATQALSRSVYARLIPSGQETEWFSLYQLGDRGTAWLGPLIFGLLFQLTGSYRLGMAILAVFFVGGLVLLARVRLAPSAPAAATI